MPQVTCKDIFAIYHVEPIDVSLCLKYVKPNHNLAATVPLSEQQVKLQFRKLAHAPCSTMEICRARFHRGNLQILLSMQFMGTEHPFKFWWNAHQYSDTTDILELLLDARVPITGGPDKFVQQLFQ